MISSRWLAAPALALLLAAAGELYAQTTPQDPHVGYVYPGGGRRGSTFEVVVGGQNIKETAEAYISGGGVKTKIVKWYRPMTQAEYNAQNMRVRVKQDELEKKGQTVSREAVIKMLNFTEKELKEREIYEKRRADPKRQPNVQIAEELTLEIQIAANATLGDRELRVITPTGMSNPLWFYVGQWPECRESEPNDVKPDASIYQQLPMVINGQIMPGDVDRFSFDAKKGAKLVIIGGARELVPYLADAVPGWFQAVLALYDEQGNEVAFADAFGFRQDPVLFYEVPKDGKYVVEIHDSIYRGREDFVYRITIGEIPFITNIFPMGGRTATPLSVELTGWNLPVHSLHMEPSFDRGRSIRPVFVSQDNIVSNRVPFAVDMLPEVMEREPNDTPETAQTVNTPVIINGRIDHPDDVDYFRFEGSGVIIAEVYARRLGSPLDSLVRLTDSHGKELGVNDDYEDKSWPLITHHADSRLLTKFTGGGTHYLRISDAQRKGGPEFAYRLHIRPPRPDFDLRVAPSSVIGHVGSCVPISVYAFRKDGFDEDIALELENPPAGFRLAGAWVPAGQDKVRLTLIVPPVATKEPIALQLNGHSASRGHRISRPAFPAEAMTQAFAYQHLVPTKDWTIAVTGDTPTKPACMFVDDRLRIPAGGSTQIRALCEKGRNAANFRFELSEPPDGISIQDPVVGAMGLAIPIKCDAAKVKVGLKGNLLFILSQEYTYTPEDKDKKPTTGRSVLGMLPAVPFEVVSSSRR